MALSRRILAVRKTLGGGIVMDRFFFGGTGPPVIGAAATTISASQPPERLNVDLSGVIPLTMAPNVLSSETSPVMEGEAPHVKVDEELVVV